MGGVRTERAFPLQQASEASGGVLQRDAGGVRLPDSGGLGGNREVAVDEVAGGGGEPLERRRDAPRLPAGEQRGDRQDTQPEYGHRRPPAVGAGADDGERDRGADHRHDPAVGGDGYGDSEFARLAAALVHPPVATGLGERGPHRPLPPTRCPSGV